jgi:phenylacetic acid degradation protein PaaD
MTTIESAVDFYARHPISAAIILDKLLAARGHLDNLAPEDLFAHDQDHYGGLAANDALARLARIGEATRVVDLCAGLGGPARYLAHRYGAIVTGVELTPVRVAGAVDLTRRVGLSDRVSVLEGNVMSLPLAHASCDAVVSQEALLHVPDVPRALSEAFRVLRPGGRIAFTNWVAHRPLSAADAQLMWEGMAVARLYSLDGHADLLRAAGFTVEAQEDLTAEWAEILRQRLAMYQALRRDAEKAGTPAGHDAFYRSYVRFVALVQEATLGGARLAATKNGDSHHFLRHLGSQRPSHEEMVTVPTLHPDEIARLSAEAMWGDDVAARHLGIERVSVGPGRAMLAMTIAPHMANGHGLCHGGYIFLLADTAFAYACNAHGQRAVAQHCAVTFVAPGKVGMRLTATAEERQRAERSGIYDITVRDEGGSVIAEFRGHSRTLPGSLLDPKGV